MIRAQAARDSRLLAELVRQAKELAQDVRPIRPRAATAVALTAADGGNNAVAFNPFSLQIVRVVDSQGKELFLDVVSPGTDVGELSRKHLAERTALGGLMTDLGVSELRELSPLMSGRSNRWVEVYRDLCEWATLYDLVCNHDFAADTLVVRDGLLRATIFSGGTLVRLGRLMRAAIERQARENRRRVWLVGLAKKTKVLDHYRHAVLRAGPCQHAGQRLPVPGVSARPRRRGRRQRREHRADVLRALRRPGGGPGLDRGPARLAGHRRAGGLWAPAGGRRGRVSRPLLPVQPAAGGRA